MSSERAVRDERTGWRDQKLSERHRQWGWDCPLIDIDFLAVEYDKGRASALVEYKHEFAAPQKPIHPSYQALVGLCNDAKRPFFGVRYADDLSWFRVTPLNDLARGILHERATMNEKEYVTFLYHLRGRELPGNMFNDADVEI